MAKVGNLWKKIIDPMAIMIRVAELMARCFWFLWEFVGFLYFLDCPPRILDGFIWRLQKKPPISNIKIDNELMATLGDEQNGMKWLKYILNFPG